MRQGGGQIPALSHLAGKVQVENAEVMVPMMSDHFVDAKVRIKNIQSILLVIL